MSSKSNDREASDSEISDSEVSAELMNRLSLADPVDPDELPDLDERKPQQLLESIMSNQSAENQSAEQHPAITTMNPRQPRRLGLMIGAAAAVLLLVGGVFAFAPSNTEPALAVVHSAAASTAEANTGRVTVTLNGEGTEGSEVGESGQVAGEVTVAFAGGDYSATVEVTEMSTEGGLDEFPVTESRLVDGTVYLNNEGQWYQMEAPEFLGETLVDIVDPRSVLTTVQELVEAEEVGTATIDGVETTHYRSVVDLADESLGESGWLASELGEIDADGEVEIDLYIDQEGLLRQLDVSGDLQEPEGGEGEATFEVSTSFFDLGADLSIEAPADAILIDPLSGEGLDMDSQELDLDE